MVRLDPSRQEEAIEAGWLAYQDRTPGKESGYRVAVSGWRAVAVCDESEVIGVLLVRDGVIHLGIKPEYRRKWASRRIIREMLSYGTRTRLMDNEDSTFISRIGFEKQGDEYVVRR